MDGSVDAEKTSVIVPIKGPRLNPRVIRNLKLHFYEDGKEIFAEKKEVPEKKEMEIQTIFPKIFTYLFIEKYFKDVLAFSGGGGSKLHLKIK